MTVKTKNKPEKKGVGSSVSGQNSEKPQKESVFLKACRGEKTPYTPVWLMRQAGRYMKDYRQLRERVPFIDLCKNKDLAAELTVMAAEKLKVDAAILFSDILLIVEPLGLHLRYAKSDGPVISGAIRNAADIDRLKEVNSENDLSFVMDAIRQIKKTLNPKIPLIGFSGAPFTLASYMIEGGSSRHFVKTKALMYSDSGAWHALMEKMVNALTGYLLAQVRAGADALQVFDSWVGCLSPEDFREFVMPHSRRLLNAVSGNVPVIHFGTGTGTFLKSFSETGGNVIGIDYRVELSDAWEQIGFQKGVQGNLDPAVLFGPLASMKKRVLNILKQAGGRPGHIFNLGHGVLPETPYENVTALVDMVHELSVVK